MPEYSLCETSNAIILHARIVGDEGLVYGGGLFENHGRRALCGAEVSWDTHIPWKAETVRCRDCRKKLQDLLSPSFAPGERRFQDTPAQTLKALPWSTEWPDQEGFWWFTNDDFFTHDEGAGPCGGFSEHITMEELEEGSLYLFTLDITLMTPERWVREGWQCCPVVIFRQPSE